MKGNHLAIDKNEGVGSARGFAGLSTMVSDVSATIAEAEATSQRRMPDSGPAGQKDSPATNLEPVTRQPVNRKSFDESISWKWLLWIITLFVIIILAKNFGGKNTVTDTADAAVKSSPQILADSQSSPAKSAAASQPLDPDKPPSEVKPPVGTTNVLSIAQIRYCLAEEIRLTGSKDELNNNVHADVDRFNALVDDYNNRCGHFRYVPGTLEQAKSEIEPQRQMIWFVGKMRFFEPAVSRNRKSSPQKRNDVSRVKQTE